MQQFIVNGVEVVKFLAWVYQLVSTVYFDLSFDVS